MARLVYHRLNEMMLDSAVRRRGPKRPTLDPSSRKFRESGRMCMPTCRPGIPGNMFVTIEMKCVGVFQDPRHPDIFSDNDWN